MNLHRIFPSILIGFLISLFFTAASAAQVLHRAPDGTPAFIKGEFGVLKGLGQANDAAVRSAAQSVLHGLLASHFGASGNEKMMPGKMYTDKRGAVHVRFSQQINGLPEQCHILPHAAAQGHGRQIIALA